MADTSLYLRLILISFPFTFIQISFSIFFVYLLVPHLGISGVAFASTVGWTIMIVYQFYCYGKIQKELVQTL